MLSAHHRRASLWGISSQRGGLIHGAARRVHFRSAIALNIDQLLIAVAVPMREPDGKDPLDISDILGAQDGKLPVLKML